MRGSLDTGCKILKSALQLIFCFHACMCVCVHVPTRAQPRPSTHIYTYIYIHIHIYVRMYKVKKFYRIWSERVSSEGHDCREWGLLGWQMGHSPFSAHVSHSTTCWHGNTTRFSSWHLRHFTDCIWNTACKRGGQGTASASRARQRAERFGEGQGGLAAVHPVHLLKQKYSSTAWCLSGPLGSTEQLWLI